jgi:adenine specific DNA methylase Mod
VPYRLQRALPDDSEAKPKRSAESLRYSKERSRWRRHRWGGSFACDHVEQVEPEEVETRQYGEQELESESESELEEEQEGEKRR